MNPRFVPNEPCVLFSENFAIPERDLCMHRAPSPDADFFCTAAKLHKGAHQFEWSPKRTLYRQGGEIVFARGVAA